MINTSKINPILGNYSHGILAMMLLCLHVFLIWGEGASNLYRVFFLFHYSLFLIWQPLWNSTEKISMPAMLILLGAGCLGVYFFNWWLIASWLAILCGMLGGRVFADDSKTNRLAHMLAASYLIAMLLLWVVPKLLYASGDLEAATFVITYLIPILPIAMLFIKKQASKTSQMPVIDFFYTLLITLIAFLLVLASYTIGSLNQVNYIQIMFITIFGIALLLVAFSLLWKPSAHFSGVELLMSRYLLSIGMPFEKWVKQIANLAENELNANTFLRAAMHEMVALEWVSGVDWQTEETQNKLGETAKHSTDFNFKHLHLSLHTHWPMSPALYVHAKLLTQVLGEFYETKRREETLRQNAYMQAFYESGSRLTHDIKNILQSVGTLVTAAVQTQEKDTEALLGLIRRQLPMLNQRIAATLDKLKAPGEEKQRLEKASAWWSSLKLRHQRDDIVFTAGTMPKQEINAEALDSVLDTLLSNATEKAKAQPNILIKVVLKEDTQQGFFIEVSDTGKALADSVASELFKKHISSPSGLGVGLYHAAQDASQAGYALSLASNVDGNVCFRVTIASQ